MNKVQKFEKFKCTSPALQCIEWLNYFESNMKQWLLSPQKRRLSLLAVTVEVILGVKVIRCPGFKNYPVYFVRKTNKKQSSLSF
jgi:hypothetical protein